MEANSVAPAARTKPTEPQPQPRAPAARPDPPASAIDGKGGQPGAKTLQDETLPGSPDQALEVQNIQNAEERNDGGGEDREAT